MTAHELVAKARNLPQVSDAALKLVGLLNDSADCDEAIDLIKSDPLLTAKLLRACNSSAMALAEPVSSVDHAILMLGNQQVMNLALSLGFGNVMTEPLPAYAIETNGLCRHAFKTATAADILIDRDLYPGVEAAVGYTAGLLHDIGKLVMAQTLTIEAHAVIQKHMSGEGLGPIEAEREAIGTDHAEVGACLLHIWRLPDLIIEAVANHHRPILNPHPQLSAIVHLANRIAHLAEDKTNGEGYEFRDDEHVVQVFEFFSTEREETKCSLQETAERAEGLLAMV